MRGRVREQRVMKMKRRIEKVGMGWVQFGILVAQEVEPVVVVGVEQQGSLVGVS